MRIHLHAILEKDTSIRTIIQLALSKFTTNKLARRITHSVEKIEGEMAESFFVFGKEKILVCPFFFFLSSNFFLLSFWLVSLRDALGPLAAVIQGQVFRAEGTLGSFHWWSGGGEWLVKIRRWEVWATGRMGLLQLLCVITESSKLLAWNFQNTRKMGIMFDCSNLQHLAPRVNSLYRACKLWCGYLVPRVAVVQVKEKDLHTWTDSVTWVRDRIENRKKKEKEFQKKKTFCGTILGPMEAVINQNRGSNFQTHIRLVSGNDDPHFLRGQKLIAEVNVIKQLWVVSVNPCSRHLKNHGLSWAHNHQAKVLLQLLEKKREWGRKEKERKKEKETKERKVINWPFLKLQRDEPGVPQRHRRLAWCWWKTLSGKTRGPSWWPLPVIRPTHPNNYSWWSRKASNWFGTYIEKQERTKVKEEREKERKERKRKSNRWLWKSATAKTVNPKTSSKSMAITGFCTKKWMRYLSFWKESCHG